MFKNILRTNRNPINQLRSIFRWSIFTKFGDEIKKNKFVIRNKHVVVEKAFNVLLFKSLLKFLRIFFCGTFFVATK